jgi:membrane-bound lytic murein transglycosylase D
MGGLIRACLSHVSQAIPNPYSKPPAMKRLLQLCPLVALAACASHLPPAPTATPVSTAVHDSLAPTIDLDALTHESSAADAAALNDLADAAPDADVPAFDARGVQWDIDVLTYANHPRVRYYLEYFEGRGRDRMAVFLSRGARYEPLIRARFQAEGLPGDLGYLALIESGYSNEAVSRAYAVGMWQFMRGTGQGYGLRVDSWVDERRDPIKATDAAARHLRDLKARFGSLYLAAAAYNAGAGKVSRSLGKLEWDSPAEEAAAADDSLDAAADTVADAESGTASDAMADTEDSTADAADTLAADTLAADTPSADTLDDAGESLADGPAPEPTGITSDAAFFRLASNDLLANETQDYVPKLIAAAIIAKAPERYGFAEQVSAPLVYDSLVVHDATGLEVVARLAGTSLTEIRELNPQYLRLVTPPRSTMIVRLPPGSGEEVARKYGSLPAKARVHYLTYVTRGERLGTVAARYHLALRDIQAANPKLHTTRPSRGTRLVIPAVAVPSALAMRATGTVGHGYRAYATHRVRRGETLTGIARHYRITVRSLRRANALASTQTLRAGMRLRIPS